MALFMLIVLIICNFTCTIGSQGIQRVLDNGLEIMPSSVASGLYFGLYDVQDTLNLTCKLIYDNNLPEVALNWILPSRTTYRNNKIVKHTNMNVVNIVMGNLTESDSGKYKCVASVKDQPVAERTIDVIVKDRKRKCSEMWFLCINNCILRRYTCDGIRDCVHGEDESPEYCGSGNPCDNKVKCPDGRCIPYSWCCDYYRESNCTTKVKHSCCIYMEKLTRDVDDDFKFQIKKINSEITSSVASFLFFYIALGSSLVLIFALIATIGITMCRRFIRRSCASCCSVVNYRQRNAPRIQNLNCSQLRSSDLNLYFNTSNNDVMSVFPVSVTYNLNNGVQFITRSVRPPPYCEVVQSPAREEPPPPYYSLEHYRERNDSLNAECNESDGLLTSLNPTTVISCQDDNS